MSKTLRVIHDRDLPEGGFAGIVEKQMLMSPDYWPQAAGRSDISHGLGDLVYIAQGLFLPNDGAPMHPHKDVDIVSVVFSGAIAHKGSLGDGTEIHAPEVQVQRAGTGMEHSEYSITDQPSDAVQIWFRPPSIGLAPGYKNFKLNESEVTPVFGGESGSFESRMTCKVGFLPTGKRLDLDQEFVLLVADGAGTANGETVAKGDLVEGPSLELAADEPISLVLVYSNNS